MILHGWDTETALFRPGVMAPELACVTWADETGDKGLSHWTKAEPLLQDWIRDRNRMLTGANIAYDMAVICAQFPDLVDPVFQAYDEDRVRDCQIRQKLLDIAAGCYRGGVLPSGEWKKINYSLADLVQRFFKRTLEKDEFRYKYGEFRELPLEVWPKGAVEYATLDAEMHLACDQYQEPHAATYLRDQYRQARAAFWLHLASSWGMRTNPKGVALLRGKVEAELDRLRADLQDLGIVRKDGSRDTKLAKALMIKVCREEGLPIPLTKTGAAKRKAGLDPIALGLICLDADACARTGDETLLAYSQLTTLSTVLNKDIPALASGTVWPIHTRYDLAESGRVTSSKPNMANWGRAGDVRDCFEPRPGFVFGQADYSGLELATLAQCCIKLCGQSALADVINQGLDPHLKVAAVILGITYEEAARRLALGDKLLDNARQTAKVANFGMPGGLGAEKLVLFARKTYKVVMSLEDAKSLKELWFASYPEMRLFFAHNNRLCQNESKLATVVQLFSERIRGKTHYTAACNTWFQGLGADATKRAGWLLSKACYVDRRSPLFGSRIVNYIYDEFFTELRDDEHATAKAEEQERIMVAGAKEFIPDVRVEAPAVLMRFWSKSAFDRRNTQGRMMPWAGECKDCHGVHAKDAPHVRGTCQCVKCQKGRGLAA